MKSIRITLALFVSMALPLLASAEIENPGFETGDTTGWTVQTNGSAFPISIGSGETNTPAGTINPSLTEDFYAFTSQGGPGSSFLFQTFEVQSGTNRIFFDIAINNDAADFFVPDPLSFDFDGEPNQQARFDILAPGAAFDTVDPDEIIAVGFQTQPGAPSVQDWERFEIDITDELEPFVGETVTLRFVQVDNQSFFNMAIDNLSVGVQPPPGVDPGTPVAINTLQTPLLLVLMALLGLLALRQLYNS